MISGSAQRADAARGLFKNPVSCEPSEAFVSGPAGAHRWPEGLIQPQAPTLTPPAPTDRSISVELSRLRCPSTDAAAFSGSGASPGSFFPPSLCPAPAGTHRIERFGSPLQSPLVGDQISVFLLLLSAPTRCSGSARCFRPCRSPLVLPDASGPARSHAIPTLRQV